MAIKIVTPTGGSGSGSGITVGTTTITGGADTQVLFDDAGAVGEDAGFRYSKATDTLQIGVASASTGSINLFAAGSAFRALKIIPNAAPTQNVDLTFPPDDGTAGQVLSTDGSGNLSWAASGAWTYVNLTADRVTALTSLADITDHSFSMLANTNYEVVAEYLYDANATTTGILLSWTGPAAPTIAYATAIVPTGSTARGCSISVTGNDTGTASDGTLTAPATATNAVGMFHGFWKNGANAGTLQMRFASEVAVAAAITLKAGSMLKYRTF